MWAYVYDAVRLAIAAILLIGGASKLVSPRPLAGSFDQVYGWRSTTRVWAVRVVAGVELLAAFLLAGGWAVTTGAVLTSLVGAGVVAFASTAMRRGATRPCGCFGESSGRPVGVRNMLAGVGLLAGAIVVLALPTSGTVEAQLILPLTAIGALVAVMVRDRARLLAPFRRHFRSPTASTIQQPTGAL